MNTKKAAIVFLVAGQSNAGGRGVLSPQLHESRGAHTDRPLIPGTTAEEVGLPTNAADYTHSYIWLPQGGFAPIDPHANARAEPQPEPGHGMELPVVRELERRFPANDIYVIKHGPGNTNLHDQWNPTRADGPYAKWLGYYREGMAQLSQAYPQVRVIGLYWDQGETDGINAKHDEYEANLTRFIATLRRDTGLADLPVFIRKHLFHWANIDAIIAAQQAVVATDPFCHLLDIDMGKRQANYDTWSFSPNNGHLSSKGFCELTRQLFDGPLNQATIESFVLFNAAT